MLPQTKPPFLLRCPASASLYLPIADRSHSLSSLYPPQAAVASLPPMYPHQARVLVIANKDYSACTGRAMLAPTNLNTLPMKFVGAAIGRPKFTL